MDGDYSYRGPQRKSLKSDGIIKLDLYKKNSDGSVNKVEPMSEEYNPFPVR